MTVTTKEPKRNRKSVKAAAERLFTAVDRAIEAIRGVECARDDLAKLADRHEPREQKGGAGD